MKTASTLAIVALLVAGCATTPDVDPAVEPIVDKTLTNAESGAVVVLGSDGTVTGSFGEDGVIEGLYEIREGQYCRTLTQPAALAGTECQTMIIEGDMVTFDNNAGRTSTWSF